MPNKWLVAVLLTLIIVMLGGIGWLLFGPRAKTGQKTTAVSDTGSDKKKEAIEKHMENGRKYIQKGDWAKAEVEFQEVLHIDPTHAEAETMRNQLIAEKQHDKDLKKANAAIEAGQFERAERYLKKIPDECRYEMHQRHRKNLHNRLQEAQWKKAAEQAEKICKEGKLLECHAALIGLHKTTTDQEKQKELLDKLDKVEKQMSRKRIKFTPYKP